MRRRNTAGSASSRLRLDRDDVFAFCDWRLEVGEDQVLRRVLQALVGQELPRGDDVLRCHRRPIGESRVRIDPESKRHLVGRDLPMGGERRDIFEGRRVQPEEGLVHHRVDHLVPRRDVRAVVAQRARESRTCCRVSSSPPLTAFGSPMRSKSVLSPTPRP